MKIFYHNFVFPRFIPDKSRLGKENRKIKDDSFPNTKGQLAALSMNFIISELSETRKQRTFPPLSHQLVV